MSQTLRGRSGALGSFNNYVTLRGGGGQSERDIVTGGRGRLYTAYVTLTFHLLILVCLTYLSDVESGAVLASPSKTIRHAGREKACQYRSC